MSSHPTLSRFASASISPTLAADASAPPPGVGVRVGEPAAAAPRSWLEVWLPFLRDAPPGHERVAALVCFPPGGAGWR